MEIFNMNDTAQFTLRTPGWKKTISLLDYRIKEHNEIIFTDAPDKEGTWYIDGDTARTYPLRKFTTRDNKTLVVRDIPERAVKFLKESSIPA